MDVIGERRLLHFRNGLVAQYCISCFNAFSRVDIRVDVKIPGGVNAYAVDLRGERYVRSFPTYGVSTLKTISKPRCNTRYVARNFRIGLTSGNLVFRRSYILA